MGHLWKGPEREGIFQGIPTLFVEGAVSEEAILQHAQDVGQIYFGAGENYTALDTNIINQIVATGRWLVTVETDRALPDLPSTVNQVYRFPNGYCPTFVKTIIDGSVFVIALRSIFRNRAPPEGRKLYEGDEMLL